MIKRIICLAIPVIILAAAGLLTVHNYFSSFPSSKDIIEKLSPPGHVPDAIDLSESFFDDSGSMRGYYGDRYIKFLRTLKSHIREKGMYKYYAFSDPEHTIEGDAWKVVEDVHFYHRKNTYFDRVLDAIADRLREEGRRAKNFLIITDGIQDVSGIQDYSRIVNRVSDLLDAGLFFQVIAVKLPFDGYKYPEGRGFIPYKGGSPLYCYVFSYQYDFGMDLYKKLNGPDLPVKFLGFGSGNIHASIRRFGDPEKNRDGSGNTFKRFKDEVPVTYLVSRSGAAGTLLMNVDLHMKGFKTDSSVFRQKTPEFCGRCLAVGDGADAADGVSGGVPDVKVTVEQASAADNSLGVSYSLFFREWDRESKQTACDLSLCSWLPASPPAWVEAWSSDCDDRRECYEGRTPFLIDIIRPVLSKSVSRHTFGYVLIRN